MHTNQYTLGELADWDAMRDSATGHELNLESPSLTATDLKSAMESFLSNSAITKTVLGDRFYDDFDEDDDYYQVY